MSLMIGIEENEKDREREIERDNNEEDCVHFRDSKDEQIY